MIEAHLICWNEADTIELTIKHYQRFCDRVIFYDNYSSDSTPDIIRDYNCELRQFGECGVLDDRAYLKVKNHCWKGSSAKWVIVADCDEVIYHPSIDRVLEKQTGDVFKTVGFEVYADTLPKTNWLELMNGVYNPRYAKSAIFSPRIDSINYEYGCHGASPKKRSGSIEYCSEILAVLHYRNVGGVDRLKRRHGEYRERLSIRNKNLGLGVHYMQEDDERIKYWHEQYNKKVHFDHYGLV